MQRRAVLTGMAAAMLGTSFPGTTMAADTTMVTDAAQPGVFIISSIQHCEYSHELIEGNYRTILWRFMDRITVVDGNIVKWETAKVGSAVYDQWLREPYNRSTKPSFIPPHVQFGGAVVSDPIGDPKFYDGWVELRRNVPVHQYWSKA